METPNIETKRLILRPININDAPAIQKHFNNWNIIKYIGTEVPWPYPDNGAETYLKDILKQMKTKEIYIWGILLKDGPNEIIGVIEYRFVDDKDDNRGFWLAEPYWGQGIMTEAVTATQDFVFFKLGKERVVVKNAKSNIGSRAVKEKSGAQLIGTSEGQYHTGETAEDVWEITRNSWVAARKNSQNDMIIVR